MKLTLLSRSTILIVFSFALVFIRLSPLNAQTVTSNTQSTHNGFFYSFWNDGSQGSASMTLGAAGNYSTTWNNIGNFTAGKGWAVGKADRVVCFSGSFDGGSNGFLALYGWTKNNLIEYYVCENHGQWTPPGNTSDIQQKGTYTSDGGTYTIYTATRTNQPSIIGTATFKQYWSVRTQTRSSGTITFANHVAAWQAAGMPMGTTWDYQIMESEGYHSSGSSNITVSECVSCATAAPTVPAAVVNYDLNATATQLTATGTALKWYTVSSGGTALTAAPTPNTSVAGTTVYYVGQTLNGCEGPRTSVTVNVVNKYKVYKVSSPLTIDGTAESPWNNASVLSAAATKLLVGTVTNSADLSGNFKALWDDTYLYVLADVNDDKLVNESANVYDDDAVEVYVDINNDKATAYGANDVQYSFGWNDGTTVGSLPSGRSTTGITYAAVAKTGGYIVEARIPWSTLQGTPAIGQLVGMDFMINDDDDNGTRDGKLSWNASADDAWEDPSLFGTAILQGLLPCTTPAAPTVTATATYCQNATATPLTATGTSLMWYTSSTATTGSATAITPSTTTVGTVNYFVTQNVGGCESAKAQIAVTVNALPTATITAGGSTSFCTGGSVTLTASTGSSYVWKNGTTQVGTAATYTATAAGSYTVEVTNANNCKATSAATTITINTAPAAPAVTAAVSYCQGATATQLTATGTALKWYADNTTTTALAIAPTPVTTTTGMTNYYVSQTTNGCESSRAQIAVTVNALPTATITAGGTTTFCSGGSVILTASTGSSYVWKNGTSQVGTAATYTATAAGSYTVEVTNANNCKATSAATAITVNAAPAAPTVTGAIAYCQNETATQLTATGTALKWYADNTTTTALSVAPTPATTAAGTTNYYVSQTTNGCESSRAQIAVTVNTLPTSVITAGSATSFCPGGSVTLTASSGSSYVWKNGTSQVGTSATYTATIAGSYTVEVTNANSCKATSAATVVSINTPPAAPVVTATVAYCQNATATQLTATGTALKWYTDNTTTTALAAAPTPVTTAIGTTNYYVSQTTTGCESTRAQIAVTINALPTATITAGSATSFCNGGSVVLTASNGSSYVWKNGTAQIGTSATYTATAAGSYTVEVTNANNCKATSAATVVTINTSSTAPAVTAAVAYCQNEIASQLTATGTGLKWYADNTTATALAAAPTPVTTTAGTINYYVSQTTSGCESARAQIAVTVNALPTATITAASATSFCTGGSVILTASNGNSYVWKNGVSQVGTAATYTATTAGSYTVEVTNANNCKATSAATVVTINTPPAAPTVTSTASYCQNETAAQLTATGTALKWYADNTTTTVLSAAPTPATTTAGTTNYYVSQSTNGCESSRAQIAVTVNALPDAVITVVGKTTIVSGETVTLNANAGANLTYKWFNGITQVGTGSSYTANAAGNYTVEVTNSSGCVNTSAITSIATAQNQPSVITITSLTNNASIQGPVTISATVTDTDGAIALVEFLVDDQVIGSTSSQPYTFIWTNPTVGEHTITVRAKDVLGGVTTSDPVTITSELTTGIHSAGNTMYGNVYPVPARYEVIVETQVDLADALFSVTNVLGEEVKLTIQVEGASAKLNVSGLSEGVYLVVVKKGSNILTKKIVVTNKD